MFDPRGWKHAYSASGRRVPCDPGLETDWDRLPGLDLLLAEPRLPPGPARAGSDFFETKVRPVLAEHCYACHSAQAKKLKGGLLLDTLEGMRKGGETGPAVVPGKPDESLLIQAIRYDDELTRMPPKGKLPAATIAGLEQWVKRGCPGAARLPPATAGRRARRLEGSTATAATQALGLPADPPAKAARR